MKTHPYLRAYMAGIFVPTLVLPILLTVFIVARIVIQISTPIEQVMIFPMAVVPSLFGLWNMAYLSLHTRMHHPIGLHGAVLPLFMLRAGREKIAQPGAMRMRFHRSLNLKSQSQRIPSLPRRHARLAPCPHSLKKRFNLQPQRFARRHSRL
jgi:hypothetical protein